MSEDKFVEDDAPDYGNDFETEDDGTTPCAEHLSWVCAACGKTSRTRYGFDAENKRCSSPGWDESCMLNAVLCRPTTADEHVARPGVKWHAVRPDGTDR